MSDEGRLEPKAARQRRDFTFIPRAVNPIKVQEVSIISTDEGLRKSCARLQAEMPWVSARVLGNPRAVSWMRREGGKVLVVDDVAMNLMDVDAARRESGDVVVVLLSFVKLVQIATPEVSRREFPYTAKADLVFAVNQSDISPDRIIASVVRAAEDHLNIRKRSDVRRFIVLIVDDEPCWPSQFLPVLYKLIGQRAGVSISRTYEEALRFMFGVRYESEIAADYWEHGCGDQVVCLITDLLFPKGSDISAEAGREFIRLVRKYYDRIPIVIASKAKEALELADAGFVLPKGDEGSLDMLRSFLRDQTGMGDFVLYDERGVQRRRLKEIGGIYSMLSEAAGQGQEAQDLRKLLEAYGERDKFSTWFYMHSYRELGDRLRPLRVRGRRMITVLRRLLLREMLRMRYTPLRLDRTEVYNLGRLAEAVRSADPAQVEALANDDAISSWLDRKGYSELADALRPIHGKGPELGRMISDIVEKWHFIYRNRGIPD